MRTVQIVTDGSCLGNPGPGGWGAWLSTAGHEKELCGGEKLTTNNRMELTAVIEALASLKRSCDVVIYTDSQYVRQGITEWIHGWKRNGWMTKSKKPVVNQDLWKDLDAQVARHKTTWVWTKGHASHAGNNRCDELASSAAREQKNSG